MSAPGSAPQVGSGAGAGEAGVAASRITRLCIYVGEDKCHGEQPLYEAIVLRAR
jgi:hypothetical protein